MKKYNLLAVFFILTNVCFSQSLTEEIKAHREKYKKDFLTEKRSPLKAEDIQYLQFYDADESFRMKATFKKTENAKPFDMATMNGSTKKYIEYGTLLFMIHGNQFTLKIYQNILLLDDPKYKDHLFLPFTDLTNGNDTYMNGRYLDFTTADIKNDLLMIDFNKAYNPYCAYSSGYSCPKPPQENNLQIEIKAGEKKFGKNVVH
jgi:uncharacterized protein